MVLRVRLSTSTLRTISKWEKKQVIFIKMALKRGVESGQFINTKGSGASGSFKVNKEVQKAKAAKDPAKKTKTADPANKPKIKKVAAKEKTARKPAEKIKKSPGKKVSSSKKKTPLVAKKTATKKPLPKKAKESKASVKKKGQQESQWQVKPPTYSTTGSFRSHQIKKSHH